MLLSSGLLTFSSALTILKEKMQGSMHMKLRDKVIKFVVEHNDRLSQAMNKTVLGEPYVQEEMSAVCRQAAAEGIVLL
jgi:hypothetical protein